MSDMRLFCRDVTMVPRMRDFWHDSLHEFNEHGKEVQSQKVHRMDEANVRRTLVCRALDSGVRYRRALAITHDKLKFVGHSGALALVEVPRV